MPRIVDHETERQNILALAFGAFARHGYDGLTMRALAAEVGASTGRLYHYFPHKEALFDSLLQWTAQRNVQRLLAAAGPEEDRPTRLRRLAAFVVEEQAALASTLAITLDRRRVLGSPDPAAVRVLGLYRRVLSEQLDLDTRGAGAVLDVLLGAVLRAHLEGGTLTAESLHHTLTRCATPNDESVSSTSP